MAKQMFKLLWVVLIFFALIVSRYEAANHYCIDGLSQSLHLDDFYHRDELIVPQLPHELELNQMKPRRCSWAISVKANRQDNQLVLEGVPAKQTTRSNKSDIGLSIKSRDIEIKTVLPGVFKVLPLNYLKSFVVKASWDPNMMGESLANLRVRIPLPEVCSRDMLSFNGSCYSISTVEQNISEALNSITGEARLASFSSMDELNNFIAANYAKLLVFPYRQPLRLDKPIRLGMFRNATDNTILSLAKTEVGCALQTAPFQPAKSENSQNTGPCVSLSVDANRNHPSIKFDNCSVPMPSLISFPETVQGKQFDAIAPACNLTESLLNLIGNANAFHDAATIFENPTNTSNSEQHKRDFGGQHQIFFHSFITAIILFCIFLTLSLAAGYCIRIRYHYGKTGSTHIIKC